MKYISFSYRNIASFGVLTDVGVIDLKKKFNNEYNDLKSFLEGNRAEELEINTKIADYKLDEINLLPVIPNPTKIVCVGLNYHEHVKEVGREKSGYPIIFLRVPDSQVGHQEEILLPKESNDLDYEGEIAIVIGKKGRRIKETDAYDYIAGYSCYNDGSIRDWQLRTDQWGPGKNFDKTGAFGPWMVSRDEIKDGEALTLETRVNGEVRQKTTTNLLIFPIPKLISFISTFTTLNPGDVIVTGTPGGVALKRDPQVFLKEGDVVEIEVSKIGTLLNKVKAEVVSTSHAI
ncbi:MULTISPECIES: fumarylacetoacetate hydrolase family protein [unclassified Sporosarcina]|uniref:fumarylacetoacetate hydrolase family protein n=1 Tax=unclassified Sporosarcina TaxID=2647733 RepID=UPI00203FE179|nr:MULTISPECIES: fumarylacetoacetate hydrolase family protein [unclassified Sporosarcina]GKV65249.1 5-carboxymethyl-2-hydroxymuconate isomerase [Sporosarcina sp. NCCP-2331]GLB55373.1 5-carboxymethyl-2-hydroxymuconate isomerase [Sporosarcina sp. NCCP-2378]